MKLPREEYVRKYHYTVLYGARCKQENKANWSSKRSMRRISLLYLSDKEGSSHKQRHGGGALQRITLWAEGA